MADSFWFGNFGSNTWVTDTSPTTGRARRVLETGVKFVSPLPPADFPSWREAAPTEEGRATVEFADLPAESGQPHGLRTLYSLAEELRPSRGKLEANDPRLDELDWVISRLFDVTILLHKNKKGLGLIHPLNIIWYVKKQKRELVLPDIGFITPKGAAVPTWLAKPDELEKQIRKGRNPLSPAQLAELKFRKVWYPDPWQFYNEFDEKKDAASLARILDWILSGNVRTSVPKVADDPLTGLNVYDVLVPVANQGIARVADLRAKLVTGAVNPGKPRATKVSLAFVKTDKVKPASARWLQSLLVLLLFGGIGSGVYLALNGLPNPARPVSGNPICPDLPLDSKVNPHLNELDALLKAPPEDSLIPTLDWLTKVTETLEAATDTVEHEPLADESGRNKEKRCLSVMRQLVRDEYEKHLSKYYKLETSDLLAPENKDAAFRRADRALNLVNRTMSLSKEDAEKWTPKWLDLIEDIRRRVAPKVGAK